jgi:hypothetical protein
MPAARLELATIAFNQPRLIAEQIRLLRKHLADPFNYTVVDASPDASARAAIEQVCRDHGVGYRGSPSTEHVDALNFAWSEVLQPSKSRYLGTLDHDIFPRRKTHIVRLTRGIGFYGVGQRHAPSGHEYLWPGLCFFDRVWLLGRDVDFGGIRGDDPADNGDTGSLLWPLFEAVEWQHMHRAEHSYRPVRKPDGYGLQSWGYELVGDWLHFSNGSNWMSIPDPQERMRLLLEIVEAL